MAFCGSDDSTIIPKEIPKKISIAKPSPKQTLPLSDWWDPTDLATQEDSIIHRHNGEAALLDQDDTTYSVRFFGQPKARIPKALPVIAVSRPRKNHGDTASYISKARRQSRRHRLGQLAGFRAGAKVVRRGSRRWHCRRIDRDASFQNRRAGHVI